MRALVRLVIMDRVRPVGASADFLERIAAVRETRARLPEVARNRLATRHRRATVQHSGLLLLIAVDDPARGVLRVGDDPRAMADRSDLLHRLEIALSRPGVDGIIATADVVEDLLMLECLDDKVVIGSMNRGGLRGAVFELDDRVTAYDVDSIAVSHLDGGKMRCRIDLADPGTTATLEACGKAITGLATRGLMALVEPSMSRRVEGEVVDDLSSVAVVTSAVVAAGLGARSSYTWLRLPVIDALDEVMAATTLPALVTGGDPFTAPDETHAAWRRALRVPGVRGMVVDRTLLYPPDGDVAASLDAAVSLMHETDAAFVRERDA